MADQPVTTTPDADTAPKTDAPETGGAAKDDEARIPYDRFERVTAERRDAQAKAKQLERELQDVRGQLEDRESKGLPELDQMRRRLEAAEKRAEKAEESAQTFEAQATNARRERWVARAAAEAKFVYPDDAAALVSLGEVETEEDAERAVKRLARQRPKLIESDSPTPDLKRVLKDGLAVGSADTAPADEPSPGLDRLTRAYAQNSK